MILATWRISSLLVEEDGPWDFFHKIRFIFGIEFGVLADGSLEAHYKRKSGKYGPTPNTFIQELFSCVLCMSIWIGAFITLIYYLNPDIAFWGSLPFALSAGAILIDKHINGG
jgi:hypothetical protein